MSRRKDRERFADKKSHNPEYMGFRGQVEDSTGVPNVVLHSKTCSSCGRKRNVPLGDSVVGDGEYVCLSCSEH